MSIYMRFAVSALLSGVMCLLLPSGFAATAGNGKSAFDKATFEAYLRNMLLVTPGVGMSVHDPKPSPIAGLKEVDVTFTFNGNTQDRTWYVSDDGKWILDVETPSDPGASLHNISENPFQSDLDKIKTAGAASFGKPNAPIKMVVYGDFECPNCKDFDQSIRANLTKTFPDQVQFFFKDTPLVGMHPWAKDAAIAGRCILRQSPAAFWDYHDWIYSQQSEINPDNLRGRIMDYAKSKGLDDIGLGHCIDTQATAPEVDEEIAQAKALGINETPTIFINGRRLIGNVPWETVQAVIKAELEEQQRAAKKDEKCCEVNLPTLTK